MLCLAPLPGHAGPAENVPFVSLYGGYLFSDTDSNLSFADGDSYFSDLRDLDPGGNGGLVGVAIGGPINPAWDWRASFNAQFLGDDETSLSQDNQVAEDRFNFQYFDLELGYRPGVIPESNLRLFAGFRALRAANDIHYGYEDESDGKLGRFDHDIDMVGIGPRIGADASIPLGNSGASISARGAASAIFTRVDHSFSFYEDALPFPDEGRLDLDDNRTVYNLEASLAVDYAVSDRMSLSVGYQAQQWWDLATTVSNAGSDTGSSDFPGKIGSGDVLTHGPFARMTIKLE